MLSQGEQDVDLLEADTEDGKKFLIFCFKESYYAMNIITLCMNLDELEGANTKRNYKCRDGGSFVKTIQISEAVWIALFLPSSGRSQQ